MVVDELIFSPIRFVEWSISPDDAILELQGQPSLSFELLRALRGEPGQVGPVGPAGGTTTQIIAAAALGGARAVCNTASGLVHASPAGGVLVDVVGITAGAAAAGALATVHTSGEIADSSWVFSVGTPVYAGVSGVLTQAVPGSGAQVVVGVAIGSSKLLVRPGAPVFLL